MTPWYKSKQFWFNVATVIVTLLTALTPEDFSPDPSTLLIAQLVIAIINVTLRFALPSPPPPARLAQTKSGAWDLQPPTATYKRTNTAAAITFTVITTALSFALLISL
jgi:hypothetical protein